MIPTSGSKPTGLRPVAQPRVLAAEKRRENVKL